MLNKTNFIKEIEQNETNKQALSQIKERFEAKPFFIEYKSLSKVVYYAKFLFALISVLCALYFVGSILREALGIESVALILALALLLLIELGKLKVLPTALRKFYAYGSLSYGLILINALLIALSVYLSVKGIEQYNTKELVIAPTTISIDSIRTHYQAKSQEQSKEYLSQINQAQSKLNEIPIKASWQKETDKANSILKENLTTQISSLIAQKSKALESIEQEKQSVISESQEANNQAKSQASESTSLNTLYLVCFALFNEIASLFCLWFVIFYEYKSLREIDLINSQNDKITIAQNDISSLFQYFKNGLVMPQSVPSFAPIPQALHPHTTHQSSTQIGFNFGSNSIDTKQAKEAKTGFKVGINTGSFSIDTKKISTKDREFLEAYKPIVNDLQEGKTYSEILGKKYNVIDLRTGRQATKQISKTTLQNINRVLKNL